MSMQPHSGNDDLDRTDELPRLDVAAYEAGLAAAADGAHGGCGSINASVCKPPEQ